MGLQPGARWRASLRAGRYRSYTSFHLPGAGGAALVPGWVARVHTQRTGSCAKHLGSMLRLPLVSKRYLKRAPPLPPRTAVGPCVTEALKRSAQRVGERAQMHAKARLPRESPAQAWDQLDTDSMARPLGGVTGLPRAVRVGGYSAPPPDCCQPLCAQHAGCQPARPYAWRE